MSFELIGMVATLDHSEARAAAGGDAAFDFGRDLPPILRQELTLWKGAAEKVAT